MNIKGSNIYECCVTIHFVYVPKRSLIAIVSSLFFSWRKWSSKRISAFLPGHMTSNWRTRLKIWDYTLHRASELLQVLQVKASCKLPTWVHSGDWMFKGSPGFGFIRYGKTHRHGNDCHEGRILLYSQIPKNRRPWHTTQGHMGKHQGWSGSSERKRRHGKSLYCGVHGKESGRQHKQV